MGGNEGYGFESKGQAPLGTRATLLSLDIRTMAVFREKSFRRCGA